MRVNRRLAKLNKSRVEDDDFVALPPEKLVDFIWELTCEVWSLRSGSDVERRLQRNITNLIRMKNEESIGRGKDKLDAKQLCKL
jgi:hypothetical protein